MAESEPVKTKEVLSDSKWICAMMEELKSIEKNKNWEIVDFIQGKSLIGVKWMYKVKENPKGEDVKHKTILVAKEFL